MFRYKNKSSDEFNIKVLRSNHLDCFKKKLEKISIPGRNDDLLIWDGSYENLELNIECFIEKGAFSSLDGLENAILNWLNSNSYERIEFKNNKIFKAYFLEYNSREEIGENSLLITYTFTIAKEN